MPRIPKLPELPKLAALIAQMTPEGRREVARFVAEHPEWADVAHVARIRRFRDAAAQLILARDDAEWSDDQTGKTSPEQDAGLHVCDRLADIFDATLGGPQGAHRDELFRMLLSLGRAKVDDVEVNVEERRARGVLLIDDWTRRLPRKSVSGTKTTARALVAMLARTSHPNFARLETRLDFVADELLRGKPRTGANGKPGRARRASTGIFTRLAIECGAFVKGGHKRGYAPPTRKRPYPDSKSLYEKLLAAQLDATRKAVKREYARWVHLKNRT